MFGVRGFAQAAFFCAMAFALLTEGMAAAFPRDGGPGDDFDIYLVSDDDHDHKLNGIILTPSDGSASTTYRRWLEDEIGTYRFDLPKENRACVFSLTIFIKTDGAAERPYRFRPVDLCKNRRIRFYQGRIYDWDENPI